MRIACVSGTTESARPHVAPAGALHGGRARDVRRITRQDAFAIVTGGAGAERLVVALEVPGADHRPEGAKR